MEKDAIDEVELSYRRYRNDNKLDKAACLIGRVMGEKLRDGYGPKYSFKDGSGIKIYVDDYGDCLSVSWNGETVLDGHSFKPGDWMNGLFFLLGKALDVKEKADREQAEKERIKLIDQMCI